MKKLGYFFFALIFNISRLFPVKEKKVILFNGHNHGLNGNLKEIKDGIERRSDAYFLYCLQSMTAMEMELGQRLRHYFAFSLYFLTIWQQRHIFF